MRTLPRPQRCLRVLSWRLWFALACVSATAVRSGQAQEAPWFSSISLSNATARFVLELPVEQRATRLDRAPILPTFDWESVMVQRPAPGQTQTAFSVGLPAGTNSAFFRSQSATNYSPSGLRMRLLHGGYFLTVDPRRALSAANTGDRYRLYVLHALLVDPASGRIAAIWPPFQDDYPAETNVARPVSDYPQLLTNEFPAPFPSNPDILATWWRNHGVASNLIDGADAVDLQGAVVTPGLIDDHFHVSSWAKKIPDEGQRFGFLPDISDPAYYAKTNGVGRRSARETLTAIVQDANLYLTNGPGVILHGFLYSWVNDDPATGEPLDTHLFKRDATNVLDPDYLLNGVGLTTGAGFEPRAAVLVQTSGQSCWYNGALLDRYNAAQTNLLANRFPPAALTGYAPPPAGETDWTFDLGIVPGSDTNLYDIAPPFDVDLRLPAEPGKESVLIPFTITRVDTIKFRAWGPAMRPGIATQLALPAVTNAELIPFFRPIPAFIDTRTWNEAAAFAGGSTEPSGTSYGYWDPRKPYQSNWYDGAEHGLLQYFYDPTGRIWRASGYAEHYVMRDLLAAVVQSPLSVADNMRFRQNVARWCHRHGLTYAHDIMVYRRRSSLDDFYAYEGLSYEHDPATDPAFFSDRNLSALQQTGRFGLRVGLYYYVESMEEVDETLALAMDPVRGFDRDRLGPSTNHIEYPGWIKWLGWKLQLDGAIASRNIFSSAPTSKARTDDAVETVDEVGNPVTFKNHSYGLLTETSEQEQEFSGRETAALYWLVRESDPACTNFWNPAIPRNWSVFRSGVTNWLGRSVNTNTLAADLLALSHVDMTVTNATGRLAADVLADKLRRVVVQVNDAYDRLLKTMAKIWYERSKATAATNPIPHQVVCHCTGDGAVDLYVKAIQTLRDDLASFPAAYTNLPDYWKAAIPSTGDLSIVKRPFSNERYRVEHLVNISPQIVAMVRSPVNGIDKDSLPATRNVVCSSQPCIMALDGQGARATAFPKDQELWAIPGSSNFWRDVPPVPRYGHIHPGPLYLDYDIPFTIDTDPPSIRDPRPALTVIGAVARTPVDIDPFHWLDQQGATPDRYPPDYLVDVVYAPLGSDAVQHTNRLSLTIEQALCAMTFWGAYAGDAEREVGALASPLSAPGGPGWLADFVVWERNPLAIRSPDGVTLEMLSTQYDTLTITQRNQAVDSFIQKFRPALTVVGGMPMYAAPGSELRWQGRMR